MIGLAVELARVSFGFPVPVAAEFPIPVMAARTHEKVVPEVLLVGLYEKVVLLQITPGVRVLVRVGIGLTCTTIFCECVQPLEVSV